jgi:hypothetical protein
MLFCLAVMVLECNQDILNIDKNKTLLSCINNPRVQYSKAKSSLHLLPSFHFGLQMAADSERKKVEKRRAREMENDSKNDR